MDERSEEPSPDSLREEGRLAEAAELYRKRGELARAEALYAELWDFHAAAEVARERGDRPAELGHLLAGNELAAAELLGQQLEGGAEPELRRAAEVYERNRRWQAAAALRERLGELETARELYRRGQALLDVARLERTLGRPREAGLAYEQVLARAPDGADAQRAHLELGQLLLALDRPEEATRQLQAALRSATGAARELVLGELIVALDRLGYREAAGELLGELRALVPITPPLRELVAQHRGVVAGPTRLGGRYEIDRLLGAGASGRVFLARDAMSGRLVAVKSLAPPVEQRAAQSWARYFAEAHLIATLRHPNVVEILDVNEPMGLVVMEYVAGGTLLDRLPPPGDRRAEPLSQASVRRLLLDVLDGLAAIHARAIVHRDLKPANLFYGATGEVKLGDFGSAYLFAEEATQTAGFIGTLAYMAPEQMTGTNVGFAADLYALGAVAFQALTGRLPFPGPDFVSQHLGDPVPLPSSVRPELAAWDGVVSAMLKKDPAARPRAVDELRRQIARIAIVDEPRKASQPSEPAPTAPQQARFVRSSPLGDGAGGAIALGVDTRLGRQVTIEALPAEYLATEAGARHLAWLKALARLGGPRLQRLFALVPREDGGLDAIFDALAKSGCDDEAARDRRLLRASLAALHAAGIAHGSLASAIVHEPHGPMITVAGYTPRVGATVDEDLALL